MKNKRKKLIFASIHPEKFGEMIRNLGELFGDDIEVSGMMIPDPNRAAETIIKYNNNRKKEKVFVAADCGNLGENEYGVMLVNSLRKKKFRGRIISISLTPPIFQAKNLNSHHFVRRYFINQIVDCVMGRCTCYLLKK